MKNYTLSQRDTGLLVVDVQEKLFARIERSQEILQQMQKMIKGALIFEIPILVTEQYPQGLGQTVPGLKSVLGENQAYMEKTSFSCMGDLSIRDCILGIQVDNWIVIGIEAHVCILQTVKELLDAEKQVVVLNDAISSRSIFDFSSAIAELRDIGARISTTETILFELLQDAKSKQFKRISQIVK